MAASPPFSGRHRARPGSLDRPVNGRMYRGTWLLAGIPLLAAAFSVSHPVPLRPPRLPPDFDSVTARQFAEQLAERYPNRSPGSDKAAEAAAWVARQLSQYGFRTEADRFHAKIPGRGSVKPEQRRPAGRVVVRTATTLGVAPGRPTTRPARRRCSS